MVGNKVYPSYLLLLDRGLSKIGSLDDKRSVSKRFPWSYDPEEVFGQCAGQWVVCLTCHHSISLLELKIISFPSRISRFDRTGCWSKGDGNSTLHGDWGTKTRSPFSLAPQSPSNFCLLEDKFWGLPVGRGRTPAQNKKQTNKQTKPIEIKL